MGGHAGHLYPQIWQGRSRERAGWGINVFQRASLAFPLLSGCSGAAWLACNVHVESTTPFQNAPKCCLSAPPQLDLLSRSPQKIARS